MASVQPIHIIGGGLAGCEAAWQAAENGNSVILHEMRPKKFTPAHKTSCLAEIICSNSLGSSQVNKASGLLMEELRLLGSLLLSCADQARIPAGHALAVDRQQFSHLVQQKIQARENIQVIREEFTSLPDSPAIIASGPLTSNALANSIAKFTGWDNLFFYDALAPIVAFESINMEIAFWDSRYQKGIREKGDYINCPFSKDSYTAFIQALIHAEQTELHHFEMEVKNGVKAGKGKYFEGCLPIEVMASRGPQTLAFGPLRPVGLRDPHTGKRPYAAVQLRQDDRKASSFNMVGFQTNLRFPEQRRVFRMIPGLESANFTRYGQMHRNSYIYSPDVLNPTLEAKNQKGLFFAGQITGVEGYLGSIATGLLAGINISRWLSGRDLLILPERTMCGALCRDITEKGGPYFQPVKANFGILPELRNRISDKSTRYSAYAECAIADLKEFLEKNVN